ncbi:MAG TPA: Crp/Fnr family transcriptional regulator [Clostridiales bacterium]|nr:Crp/Fnr family transcriptional regulator [Clostridiales bacterium]
MDTTCDCGRCKHDICIHRVPIFSTLNEKEISNIAELINHHDYKKGEIVVSEGDSIDSIIIMNQGSAKAFKYTLEGREQILYIFAEGDFFGEKNLLSNQRATFFVEALQDIKTCSLSRYQFQKLLYKYPDIGIKIIDELGKRLSRLENSLQSMGVRNVDSRLGSLLIDFQEKFGVSVSEGTLIQLPLSREGMANYLGVARETVSRKLGQFEQEGIIRTINNKSILITDQDSLNMVAGSA